MASLIGPISGVSGNGVLATIFLEMLEANSSPVMLSNVTLLDSRLREMPVTTAGATVTAVPEPRLLALLALSLVVGIGQIQRKRPNELLTSSGKR